MIDFQIVRGRPTVLASSDLQKLGRVLGTMLRLHEDRVVSLLFVSEKAMQAMNKRYRKVNRPTDVLSFETSKIPTPKTKGSPREKIALGDIVICHSYAKKEAKRRAIEPKEELVRLCVHGVLHLMGMDHAKPSDELKMFRLQERIVERATA